MLSEETKKSDSVKELYHRWRNDLILFEKSCNKLFSLNLKALSNQNLAKTYNSFYDLYLNEYSLALLTDGFGFLMDGYFPELLSKILDGKKLSDITINLSAPMNLSFFEREKIDLYSIAQKFHLSSRNKFYTKEAFADYAQQYYWIKSNYEQKDILTKRDFVKKIREVLMDASLEDLLEKNYFKKIRKQKREIIKKFKLGKKERIAIKLIEITMYWQDKRKKANMIANYWLHTLNSEIARRTKVELSAIECLTPHEIINIFKNKKPLAEVDKRQKRFGIISIGGKILNIPYEKIEEVRKGLLMVNEGKDGVIHGTTASPGMVNGVVKIIQTIKEVSKIRKGEIIVCSMTRPELMPAVKKAKAIVTDEGGITCHAAIISRELKIPCIIGTKIATKILKDGDFVEVDANNGVIRVLEKSK